jgi:hypothetical protein
MIQIEYLPIVLTGIGIIVSILYYTSVLRNANKTQQMQLETRQATLFMNVYNRWDVDMANAFHEVMSWEWDDFDDFMEKYGWLKNREKYTATAGKLTGFYEGIGVLVKEGFLDIRLITLMMAGVTKAFWEKMGSVVLEARVKMDSPLFMSETEYLYQELTRYLSENPNIHGTSNR